MLKITDKIDLQPRLKLGNPGSITYSAAILFHEGKTPGMFSTQTKLDSEVATFYPHSKRDVLVFSL